MPKKKSEQDKELRASRIELQNLFASVFGTTLRIKPRYKKKKQVEESVKKIIEEGRESK